MLELVQKFNHHLPIHAVELGHKTPQVRQSNLFFFTHNTVNNKPTQAWEKLYYNNYASYNIYRKKRSDTLKWQLSSLSFHVTLADLFLINGKKKKKKKK